MKTCAKAVVLGNGLSGKAAAQLLQAEAAKTLILDEKSSDFSNFKFQTSNFPAEIVVVSPGFPLDHPWIQELRKQDIPLISELELGWSRRKSRVAAVTGSNGKSTAVKWIADALNESGQLAVACGNYGVPLCEAVLAADPPDWLVVEVSSFQLETVRHFRPEVGVLLNILPNHLDRHGTLSAYRALKLRLFRNQAEGDIAIVPLEFATAVPGAKTFGAGGDYPYIDGRVGAVDLRGTLFESPVLGPCTGAAVVAACEACGLPASAVEASAKNFKPLPHRLEFVAEIGGVRFIDDSKATNLAALCAAVQTCGNRIHLIAGGRVKERNFSLAKDFLAERVLSIYLCGEASGLMQSAWGNTIQCVPCQTLEKAVREAWKRAERGDCVLLSPACTSFDRFADFNERGETFVRLVKGLKSGGC